MKKKLLTAIITAALVAFGLSSELAKEIAVVAYCKIQPHDCSKE